MLKDYRKKYTNFTQIDMAALLNISPKTYYTIEKNNNCELNQARSISEIFGDSIENIFFKKIKE